MDERLRKLERDARRGDPAAIEELYRRRLDMFTGDLLDRLVERVIMLERGRNAARPSTADKLAWLDPDGPVAADAPAPTLDPSRALELVVQWSEVRRVRDLRAIPAGVPFRFMGVYSRQESAAYRWRQAGSDWERVCFMGTPPTGFPFFVVDTLADRLTLPQHLVRRGCTCLVLETMVLYSAERARELGPGRFEWEWNSVRIERRRSR